MSTVVDVFIDEDFSDASGSTPPLGWSSELFEGDPAVDEWRFDNPGDRLVPSFLTTPFAIFDSDFLSNNDLPEEVALVSPVFDTSNETQVFLEFDQEYLGLIDPQFGSTGFIQVYDGTAWQTVQTQVNDAIGTTRLDISDVAAGVENAQVRFLWEGNWSYYWALDNVRVVDQLTPGVTVSGSPQVSEDNVPDPRRFQFVLDSKPTSDVTISFEVDSAQLGAIASLTFTPDNWNIAQTAVVTAVADGIAEGENQQSTIQINVSSEDDNYNGLAVPDAIATITDSTIPGFPSYRTVEETYRDMATLATNNPTLATWTKFGESYDKVTAGGAPGYDLQVLKLTNQATDALYPDKPVLYIQGSIHAREYSTAESVARFAEQLVAGYGVNADITWLLDYFQIHVVPILNPDGRKFAEQGYSWRKNTNPTPPPGADPVPFPNYGVDLNRNYDSKWGEIPGGASTDPADLTYQGPTPFSEPESRAARDYLLALFEDQKGPNDFDPAPEDTTGVYLDVHSFGNLVLYPFGWTNEPAPNYDGLRNLGLKFGYFTGVDGEAYDVQQAIGLYPTSGTTDDWVYDTFGVAAYTLELGTSFFQDVETFENTIVPEILPAYLYAAKSAYRPYQTSAGPDSINVALNMGQIVQGSGRVVLSITADDTRYDDDNGNSAGVTEGLDLPNAKTITAGRYSIGKPSWLAEETFTLQAADGAFDSPVETLTATIDTSGLTAGRYTIFVESQDASGVWGVPTAVFLDVLTAPTNANIINGTDGNDTLRGTRRADVMYGYAGDDVLRPSKGDDIQIAGTGNDNANGGRGNDLVYGGAGTDTLYGGRGNDKVYGEDGDDLLYGGRGNDVLWGGQGADAIRGGSGTDTFVLAAGDGTDIIYDFKRGTDRIGLAGTLEYNVLSITQGDRAALVSLGTEVLAQFRGISATDLTAAVFVPV